MSLAVSALLVALPGCYLSYADLADGADGGPDRTDAAPDDGRDVDVPDGPPPEWRWTDRDIPDRSIPVGLYFASVPAIAWNDGVAGLVYQGLEPGSDERLAFIPLDARGNAVGSERQLWSGRGVRSQIPHIVADGELFLVTFGTESGPDRLVLARVDPAGNLVESMETPLESGAVEPVVPPVVLDEYFLAPFRVSGDDERIRVLRVGRGTFPDSRLFEVPLESPYAGGPFVLAPGSNPDVAMLFYGTVDGRTVGGEYTDGLVRTSSPDVRLPATGTAMDLAAAVADETYLFKLGAVPGGDGLGRLATWSAERGSQTDDFAALFPGGLLAASGGPRPAWGATFALVEDDRWRIAAVVAAEPVPGTVVRLAALVDDGVSPRRLEDMPRSGIAWTGNGFLVVWDEWREEASAYGLYASYLELHTGP